MLIHCILGCLFIFTLLCPLKIFGESSEDEAVQWETLQDLKDIEPKTYFGKRDPLFSEPGEVPYSEGPFRRFSIIFAVSLFYVYFYNELLTDQMARSMRTWVWTEGWNGVYGSTSSDQEIVLREIGRCPEEGCFLQYRKNVKARDINSLTIYMALSATMVAAGVALSDFFSTYTNRNASTDFPIPNPLDGLAWRLPQFGYNRTDFMGQHSEEASIPEFRVIIPLMSQKF